MSNPPVMVKGPAGQYTSDLLKGCEDHFSRVYPECVDSSDHKTIMCPAAFKFGYVAPRGEASGATPLSGIEKVTFIGDADELKIFEVLETFGGKTKQPMFVLPKFKFKDFTEKVLQKILPADHPTLVKLQHLEGEVDFVIVHRRIGVILIEVKGMPEFNKKEHRKAKKQLNNGEEIIQALLHGIGINVPVYKVIAFPNVSDCGRVTSGFINLREINVCSHDEFQCWWTTSFVEVEFGSSEQEKIQKLIAILVSHGSEVSSRAEVLSDVFKKIDTQSFLQRSFEKRATVDESDVVRETNSEPELTILAKQFMFLNPEQLRIWNGPCRQVFCGVTGSGKTILIQFKALECAKKGEKVFVIVPRRLTKLYKSFIEINNVLSKIDVLSHDVVLESVSWQNVSEKFHVFVDEWQLLWAGKVSGLSGISKALHHLITQTKRDSCYCWITYDYKQWSSKPESVHDAAFIHTVQSNIEKFVKENAFYHAASLTTNTRSTIQVHSYWNSASRGDKSLNRSHDGFPLYEYWSHPVCIGHHICGPPVKEIAIPCTSSKGMLQVIKHEIESWAKDGEVYAFHKVAILVKPAGLCPSLGYELRKEHIPVCRAGDNCNAVVLEAGDDIHSYEWPVVIAICTRKARLNYLMFTRAVARLVVLYVDSSFEYPHI